MISLNCQSLNAKFDELKLFIERINENNPIGIVALRETWLSEDNSVAPFFLDDCHLVSIGKHCCGHGGLMIYICALLFHYLRHKYGCTWLGISLCSNISDQKIHQKIYYRKYS